MHPLKRFIYHHNWIARLYNIRRTYSRNKYNHLSDEAFAQYYYNLKKEGLLDLEDPRTYDEKLWVLKLKNRDPLLRRCTDKYEVREYVKELGLEHILNELYGVYNSYDEIDFQRLPSPCILKCNHTSGVNAIYEQGKEYDHKYNRNEFNFFMKRDSFWGSREWNYKGIESKIICEKLLEQPGKECLDDYKFMCFHGEVKLVFGEIGICGADGSHNANSKRNVYTRDYELIEGARFTRENFDPKLLPKPKNYDKMLAYAELLAKPFIHARVDLYNIDGDIYFGEITFYHQGCTSIVVPDELYYEAGSWIDLSQIKQ